MKSTELLPRTPTLVHCILEGYGSAGNALFKALTFWAVDMSSLCPRPSGNADAIPNWGLAESMSLAGQHPWAPPEVEASSSVLLGNEGQPGSLSFSCGMLPSKGTLTSGIARSLAILCITKIFSFSRMSNSDVQILLSNALVTFMQLMESVLGDLMWQH